MYELTVRLGFAAAHRLNYYGGKCEQLHGHNWKVELTVQRETLDKIGLAIDFGDLKAMLGEILERLDHSFLNENSELEGINPTSENLARLIYQRLRERLPSQDIRISRVTVWESDNACAAFLPPRE